MLRRPHQYAIVLQNTDPTNPHPMSGATAVSNPARMSVRAGSVGCSRNNTRGARPKCGSSGNRSAATRTDAGNSIALTDPYLVPIAAPKPVYVTPRATVPDRMKPHDPSAPKTIH